MTAEMEAKQAKQPAPAARLGLRLGADLFAAGVAALSITPVVCLIDRYAHQTGRGR